MQTKKLARSNRVSTQNHGKAQSCLAARKPHIVSARLQALRIRRKKPELRLWPRVIVMPRQPSGLRIIATEREYSFQLLAERAEKATARVIRSINYVKWSCDRTVNSLRKMAAKGGAL